MPWLGLDGRLVVVPLLVAVTLAPLDGLSHFVSDRLVFWLVIVAFVVVSVIGTKVVLRTGELPANDELFNMRELSAVQRAALRGDHVKRS